MNRREQDGRLSAQADLAGEVSGEKLSPPRVTAHRLVVAVAGDGGCTVPICR